MTDIVEKAKDFIGSAGINILYAVLVFLIGLAVIGILNKLVRKWIIKTRIDPMLHVFVLSVVRITLVVLLAVSCAGMIGVDVTSFITALGAAGLAVGLALQDSLTNLAGGVFIIVVKPFTINDYIEVGSVSGSVTQIGLVYTTLATADNRKILIPNADIAKSKIVNYTANPERRLELEFLVGYDADIEKAKRVVYQVVRENPLSRLEPEPIIRCGAHKDSAVVIVCKVWVETKDYWDLNFDLYEQVKAAFDREGIRIPYNQLDVHITEQRKTT